MIRKILNILGWAGAAVVFAAFAIWIIPDTALPSGPDWAAWQRRLALSGLVLVLLYMLSQWRDIGRSFSGRQARYGTLTIASVAVVLGILVAIVTLQLPPLLSQTALRDATRQMVANLQYVRMKAVSQNRRLRVTFRPINEDYMVDKDEEGVWQRQLLISHSAEAVAEATIPLPRGVRIVAVNSGGDIIFLPRGVVDGGIRALEHRLTFF